MSTLNNQQTITKAQSLGSIVHPVDPLTKQAITEWVVAALYQFKSIADARTLQAQLEEMCQQWQLCGTLIVASEGINGTVSGSRIGIDQMHDWLVNTANFDNLEYKESFASLQPFKRLKIKLKNEIVTLGVPVKPTSMVGHYLNPEQWHDFIQQDGVVVVDTRNDYEYKAGTFKNALDPNTKSFREFPQWVEENLSDKKNKKIAMFCTGGIRCEKSTSLLLQQGFSEVFHLKGGILNYLEQIPPQDSLWQGDCFVFDDRVAVSHGVAESQQMRCHGCGWPLTQAESELASYEKGVSCVYCIDKTTEQQKASFRMRQRQFDRGEVVERSKKQNL